MNSRLVLNDPDLADVPPKATAETAESRSLPQWLYLALSAAIVLVYWLPRLYRGFWVDEAGAYWIARNGFGQVWHNMQIYPGQSIIYAHLSSWFAYSGPYKEALFRLPSVAGVLISAWLLFKFTERVVGRGSGFLAVGLFLSAGAIVQTATNARPYALGMVVILASCWSLREWVHTGSWRHLVVYCLVSPLVVYFHYLFGIIFAVQMLYLIAARRSGRAFQWKPVLVAGFIILVAALPLAWQVLTIVHQSDAWKTAVLPTVWTFIAFYPVQVVVAVVFGLLLFRFLHREWFGRLHLLASDDLVLLVMWMLLGPILLFFVMRTTGLNLFAARYLIYALLPFFVLAAWAIRQVRNEIARFVLLLGVAINAAVYVPGLQESEWRTPLELAQSWAGADTPLLVRSGYVESASADLRGEPRPSSYFFAPLSVYPVRNEVIPVPFFVNGAAARSLQQEILKRAEAHRRFCLVANVEADVWQFLPAWFRSQGYQASAHRVNGITIMLFERIS